MKTKALLLLFLMGYNLSWGQTTIDHSITEGLRHPSEVKNLELNSPDSLEFLRDFPNLVSLSISNWDAPRAPLEIGDLINLKELRFVNDRFDAFPDTYLHLKQLVKLELINDSIPNLEPILLLTNELPSLRELRLEGFSNNLFKAPLTFPKQISRLSLRNNHLETIPSSIYTLSNLEVLDLGNNELLELAGLEKFTKINTLYLDHQKYPNRTLEQFNCIRLASTPHVFLPRQDGWLEDRFLPTPSAKNKAPFVNNRAFYNYQPNLSMHFTPDETLSETLAPGKLTIRLNK